MKVSKILFFTTILLQALMVILTENSLHRIARQVKFSSFRDRSPKLFNANGKNNFLTTSSHTNKFPLRSREDFVATNSHTNNFPRVSRQNLLPAQNECGRNFNKFKLFNGRDASFGEFPWMAALGFRKRKIEFNCGGALINNRYVITAAHCVHKAVNRAPLILVRLGEHDLSSKRDCRTSRKGASNCAPQSRDFRPEKVLTHPGFHPQAFSNDVAVIRLTTQVEFTNFISPICLPNFDLNTRGLNRNNFATLSGWGQTETGEMANKLQKLLLPYFNLNECKKKWKNVSDKQICFGGMKNIDSCDGDSGSPLVLPINMRGPRYELVGIVSYGHKMCGTEGVPAVYTNVVKFRTWIVQNLLP